jgi:hypothetical protein
MLRLLNSLFLVLVLFVLASAQSKIKYQGYAEKGGKVVRTSTTVSYKLMETFPGSLVTVYATGTTTLLPIYSDAAGAVKSNPFTSDSTAFFSFYADRGVVLDIKFSGTGITTPFTLVGIAIGGNTFSPYDPFAFGAVCDNVANDTVAFNSLISAIGSANGTIAMPRLGPCKVDSITFPKNITIDFNSSGGFYINNGQTLTLAGTKILAAPVQIFYNALAGQGTARFTDNSSIRALIPEYWGASVSDTVDDTAAIVATIAAVANYGTIELAAPSSPTEYYKISSTITIAKPIIFRGLGGAMPFEFDNNPALGPPYYNLSGARTRGPKFLWAGSATPMFYINNTEGVKMSDIVLDGAGVASNNLILDSARHCSFVSVHMVRSATLALHVGSTSSENNGSRLNSFKDCVIYGPSALKIAFLPGGSTGGYHNDFYSCEFQFEGTNGIGIDIINGDNNSFHNAFAFNQNGSSTKGVHIGPSLVAGVFNAQLSYSSYFFHLQTIGVWVDAENPHAGAIYGLDQANTANLPVIGANSKLTYFIDGRNASTGASFRNSHTLGADLFTDGVVYLFGGVSQKVLPISATGTVDPLTHTIEILDAASNNITRTLPTPANYPGFSMLFIRADASANTVTIATPTGQIGFGGGLTYTGLNAPQKRIKVFSSHGIWVIETSN